MDFVVTENAAPRLLVEAKLSDRPLDKSLRHLSDKYPDPRRFSSPRSASVEPPSGISLVPAVDWLPSLV